MTVIGLPRVVLPSIAAAIFCTAPLAAQDLGPALAAESRLVAVLPAEVATRILERIASARAADLPAEALEHRALELVAKGVEPAQVEEGVARHAERLGAARAALVRAGRVAPDGDETEAAELAIRSGADGAAVSALAQAAPSGQSLAVPLFVLAGLMDRGLPSDQAIARVHAALTARAAAASANGRPAHARGRPESIPANGGRSSRPRPPGRT
ncbi:MAG TPA: hypothetical protein VF037_10060 [Gemmatimonadales bacterium]